MLTMSPMKPQTSSTESALLPAASTTEAGTFAFFFIVRSPDTAMRARIVHRLDLEFGLAQNIAPFELSIERKSDGIIVAVHDHLDGDRLAAFQQHANRIATLYAESGVCIQVGHASATKVTIAYGEDGPDRIYLRGGIWGAILCERNSTGKWNWKANESTLDPSPELFRFFESLAEAEVI